MDPTLLLYAVLLLGAGIFAGLLAGLLGVGGGIVIVPVMYHILSLMEVDFAYRMHLAVGTSLATIIFTSLRSVRSHAKRGAVDTALLRRWAPAITIGVFAGTALAAVLNSGPLVLIFATVALLVALQMSLVPEGLTIRPSLPQGALGQAYPGVIGLVSAMMGIGGATLSVPILSAHNVPIHKAVATAPGFGLIIAVPGTIGFIVAGWGAEGLPATSLGYVSVIGVAIIVPATFIAVPFGVRLAHWLSPLALKRAFALFLALTSLRMYWDYFG